MAVRPTMRRTSRGDDAQATMRASELTSHCKKERCFSTWKKKIWMRCKVCESHEKHEKGCHFHCNDKWSTSSGHNERCILTMRLLLGIHANLLKTSAGMYYGGAALESEYEKMIDSMLEYAKHNSFQFVKCIHGDPPTWQVMDNSDPVIRQQIRRGMACLVEDTDVEWDPNN